MCVNVVYIYIYMCVCVCVCVCVCMCVKYMCNSATYLYGNAVAPEMVEVLLQLPDLRMTLHQLVLQQQL
jgi:hypothetical protein